MTTRFASRLDPARRIGRYAPAALAWAALIVWLVANMLPGFVGGFNERVAYPGVYLTFGGWQDAVMARDGLALIGWTANLWLAAAAVRLWDRGRKRSEPDHRVAAGGLTAVAGVCGLVAIWALAQSEYVAQITVGTWIWVSSIGIFAVSTVLWVVNLGAAGTSPRDDGPRLAEYDQDSVRNPLIRPPRTGADDQPSRWIE
jgi:hypothetical protein